MQNLAVETMINIFKYVSCPINLIVTCRKWFDIANDPYAKLEWLIEKHGKPSLSYNVAKLGPSFIDTDLCQTMITKKIPFAIIFVLRLSMHYENYQELVEILLYVKYDFNQFDQLDPNRFRTFLQIIGESKDDDYNKKLLKLFNFLSSASPHEINHVRTLIKGGSENDLNKLVKLLKLFDFLEREGILRHESQILEQLDRRHELKFFNLLEREGILRHESQILNRLGRRRERQNQLGRSHERQNQFSRRRKRQNQFCRRHKRQNQFGQFGRRNGRMNNLGGRHGRMNNLGGRHGRMNNLGGRHGRMNNLGGRHGRQNNLGGRHGRQNNLGGMQEPIDSVIQFTDLPQQQWTNDPLVDQFFHGAPFNPIRWQA